MEIWFNLEVLPKVTSPTSLNQWRPILMMGDCSIFSLRLLLTNLTCLTKDLNRGVVVSAVASAEQDQHSSVEEHLVYADKMDKEDLE